MKKMILSLFFFLAATGFADSFTLENQTPHPSAKSKIAVQWASSAKEVDEGNKAVIHGLKLNGDTLQVLNQLGKIVLKVPKNAQYFRVLSWSKGKEEPEHLTNWVEIVPNKIYTLKTKHLIPAVLMCGTGC